MDMIGDGSSGKVNVYQDRFEFKLDLSEVADPIVHVLFAGEEIRASPQVNHRRKFDRDFM